MKRTRKNMLRSSAAMLMVSALALTTATYAWFTSAKQATVKEFKFTASSAGGLQISADANNWSSNLKESDFTGVSGNLLPDSNLYPVSSVGAVSNKALKLFQASFNGDTIKSETATEGNYIKYNLYVKNDGTEAMPLYLDFASGNQSRVTAQATDSDTGIQNAIRVAFIENASISAEAATINVADMEDKGATSAKLIWEPNANVHKNRSSVTGTETTYALKAASSDNGVTAENSMFASTETSLVEAQTTLKTTSANNAAAESTQITSIPAHTIIQLTVYIWMEGQDKDCTNLESGGTVNVDLAFTGVLPTT